jgi:hypothetical protein
MKKLASKLYIIAFYLCSTFVMFAQDLPGESTGGSGTLDEDTDTTPGAAIDHYVLLLAVVGMIFVFMKFRAMQKNRLNG